MDVQADALFFQARELDAAIGIVEERVVEPDFQFHTGLRASIGTEVGCDCYELKLQYLHYHARTRGCEKGPLLPTWGHLSGEVDNATSMWRLHMGLLDLLLSRVWEVSSCLSLEPTAGLRYAEVRRKSDLTYGEAASFSMKNKFWAVGPLIGLKGLWRLFGPISLYSRGALSLLFGKVYVHLNEFQEVGASKLFDELFLTRPYFEGALGLEARFCIGSWMVSLRGAAELYLLENHDQYKSMGDLTLVGASAGIGLDF